MPKSKRLTVATLATALSSIVFTAAAGAHQIQQEKARERKAPTCRRGGSHGQHWRRVVTSLQGEVYEVYHREEASRVYGCAYGGRAYELGQRGPSGNTLGEDVERFVLSGDVVAFYKLDTGRGGNEGQVASFFIQVVNLQTGKSIYEVPTGTRTESMPSGVGTGPATAIALKPDGSVAWIARDYEKATSPGTPYYQVHELGRSGEQLLDSGANIDPESLALAGSTIYWTNEDKPFSAMLN